MIAPSTTPTLSDRAALLKAIAFAPDDNVLRLAYADELDAHATTDAERGRAALIRVQCKANEWAGKDDQHCLICGQHWKWRVGSGETEWLDCNNGHRWRSMDFPVARSDELIRLYATAWRRPPCPKCGGKGYLLLRPESAPVNRCQCPACKGTGTTGGPLSELVNGCHDPGVERLDWKHLDWKHTVNWHRGMPVVDVPFADMVFQPDCELYCFVATWLAWACEAVKDGAIFRVTGRIAYVSPYSEQLHNGLWFEAAVGDAESHLQKVIFKALQGGKITNHTKREYESSKLAHTALDNAVLRLVAAEAYPESKEG